MRTGEDGKSNGLEPYREGALGWEAPWLQSGESHPGAVGLNCE